MNPCLNPSRRHCLLYQLRRREKLGPGKIKALALGLALFACAAYAGPDTDPANPRANAATRAVLKYFQSLSTAPERRIVSGQFSNFGKGANLRALTNVYEKTGHWPAILGVDYADLGRGGLETARPNQTALAYWNQGGLVTISAHLYDPACATKA
jgi:mannan endo-1,4-beta-mannosidase